MRKTVFRLLLVAIGLYVCLHLVLASSPVQRRVLDEIRKALATIGLDLEIESIEFSALTPKIYLNRVTLRARPGGAIPLTEPLAVDKIKIEFQPLALVYRKIVIEEAVLFHPVIAHDAVDRLAHRVEALAEKSERSEKKKGAAKSAAEGGSRFQVVVRRVGVVDALLNIAAHEPGVAVRTPTFTAFLSNIGREPQTVTVETKNFQLDYGRLKTTLRKVDLDVDLTKKSLRVNKAIVDSDELSLNLKGVSGFPSKGTLPQSVNASYDVRIALRALTLLPGWKGPEFDGVVASEGTVAYSGAGYGGNGSVKYEGVTVDGYAVGSGHFNFGIERKLARLSDAVFRYGGGELRSNDVQIELHDRLALSGDLVMQGVQLHQILDGVKATDVPIRMQSDGNVKAGGFLTGPMEITVDLKNRVKAFTVLNDAKKPVTEANTLLAAGDGTIDGRLTFHPDKMAFDAKVGILGGTLGGEGYLSYDHYAKFKLKGEALSLSQLGRISDLQLGGAANVAAELEVQNVDARISGDFDVAGAEVAGIVLGQVRGQATYRNGLLSFENLEVPSLEPVRANGYVDFSPRLTHYRFQVDARRMDLDQCFNIFQKTKLDFSIPKGGEGAVRLSIEGGHDEKGIEVNASGGAKNFTWYGERWQSSAFSLNYRSEGFDLKRVLLMKKTGGVEVRGRFRDKGSEVSFQSQRLLAEELDYFGKAPISGEVAGDLTLEFAPKQGVVSGRGEVKLVRTTFRGGPLPDTTVRVRPVEGGMELLGNVGGDRLRGRLLRQRAGGRPGELLLYFSDFDFAPFVTVFLGKDIASMADLTASGDVSLVGDFGEWRTLRGSGSITRINMGLKGTPMRNREPIQLRIDKGILVVERTVLVGAESQVSLDFSYKPGESIQGSLDGKLDLQFVQPFIPGLDYGVGPLTVGLRLSGHPDRYTLIGNITLEDGSLRLTGLTDEFRAVQAQLSVSQDRINVDRFETAVNGGALTVEGDVRINKFHALIPSLRLSADRVLIKTKDYLQTRFSGDFTIRGQEAPYLLAGKCRILDASLTKFDTGPVPVPSGETPPLSFDITCDAKDKLLVKTDIMDAEFRGNFHMVGNTSKIGLLGSTEVIRGTLLFRETKFELGSGTAKFESPSKISPRFNIAGRALVKEQRSLNPVEYEVSILVIGTPEDYRIRLTSSPALSESDIISLLLLGITGKTQEGNYMDLGTAVVGQIPIQSKFQSQLGLDIKLGSKTTSQAGASPISGVSSVAPSSATADPSIPNVTIQKEIIKNTKISYSSTLDASPIKEYKLEQMLDDNFTLNASRIDNPHGTSTSTQGTDKSAYGIDLRYRFQFE